jgi:hypothetical protein
MNVEFIARVTCACGTQVDVPAAIEMELGCSPFGGGPCRALMTPDLPFGWGWLGGYDDEHPYMCPACVKRRYAP